jgi:hypothetical protein
MGHQEPAKSITFESLVEHFASLSIPLTASASSVYDDEYKAENALAKGPAKYFWSKDVPGSWWAVDFGIEVILEGYRMPLPSGYCYAALGWDFEISGDGVCWTISDSRREVPEDGRADLFPLRPECACRHARVRLVGKNFHGNDRLWIPEADFKGRMQTS